MCAVNLAFAAILTFVQLPVHRDPANAPRDFTLFVWAVATLVKEIEFVMARGLREYANDPHCVIGMCASLCSCAATLLNVCHRDTWPHGGGDGIKPDTHSFWDLWGRCDEVTVPLVGREVRAALFRLSLRATC